MFVLAAHPLVHLNATLNTVATVLLLCGWWLIRQRRELAHRRAMLAAFGVSIAFLVSYVCYHAMEGSVPFPGTGAVRGIYFTILISHVILAAVVPFLAVITIVLGLKAFAKPADPRSAEAVVTARRRHRRWARWTFPIWLYVSVTGVVVYVMLYHLYSPPGQ